MLLAPEEVLEQLDAVLDAAASVGVDDAETWSVQLQRRLNRLEAIVTAAVGDVDRSGSIGNARNTAAWFAHRAGLPKHRATRLVVNAKAMRSMPSVAAAFAAGEVNGDHVAVLASAHATNPEAFEKHEDDLVDVAKVDRFDLFERHVTYWRQIAAPDVVEDEAERQNDARSCSASRSFEDAVFVDATLDPVGGSIFLQELQRLEHRLWEDDQRTGASRTNRQRRADALVVMAERSAAMPPDAKRGRVLLNVLVGYETFAGRICELADGTVLTPGQVVSLLDVADVERVVFAGPSKVIDVGVRQRVFTGATRTAVNLVHLECQGDPSCDVRFDRCEIDHVEPYGWGGLTVQANGEPDCPWHHRKRHRSP